MFRAHAKLPHGSPRPLDGGHAVPDLVVQEGLLSIAQALVGPWEIVSLAKAIDSGA